MIDAHTALKSLNSSRDRQVSPIGEIASDVSPIGRTCCGEIHTPLRALVALCFENSETPSRGSCRGIDICRDMNS